MGKSLDVDLTVPRAVRFIGYGHNGEEVKNGLVAVDEEIAPRQLAHALLHADAIVRVQVFDLDTDQLLIDRSEPSDVVDS